MSTSIFTMSLVMAFQLEFIDINGFFLYFLLGTVKSCKLLFDTNLRLTDSSLREFLNGHWQNLVHSIFYALKFSDILKDCLLVLLNNARCIVYHQIFNHISQLIILSGIDFVDFIGWTIFTLTVGIKLLKQCPPGFEKKLEKIILKLSSKYQ